MSRITEVQQIQTTVKVFGTVHSYHTFDRDLFLRTGVLEKTPVRKCLSNIW
jgi:hypothetical protein